MRLRFESALATPGVVSLEELRTVPKVFKQPVGAAVALVCRERLTLEAVDALISTRSSQPLKLNIQSVSTLQVTSGEMMICQRLAAGDTLEMVLEGTTSPERVMRTVATLVALGLWS